MHNKNIKMMSPKYRVLKILKRTNAKMFKDIRVGDIIQFSVPIRRAGGNRGKSYSVDIEVENLSRESNTAYKTFNQLPKLLTSFEIEQVYDD